MTTDPLFDLRPTGEVVLHDDDGEPAYYLRPEDALHLGAFIRNNEPAIEKAAETTRTARAYTALGQHIAGGAIPPRYVTTDWRGRLLLSLDSDEDLLAWGARIDGTPDTKTHPTLGSRRIVETSLLVAEGPWDREPVAEPVSA